MGKRYDVLRSAFCSYKWLCWICLQSYELCENSEARTNDYLFLYVYWRCDRIRLLSGEKARRSDTSDIVPSSFISLHYIYTVIIFYANYSSEFIIFLSPPHVFHFVCL